MSKCARRTQGGKGNEGMFIERDPKIFAAGKPTPQATETVGKCLKHYLLKEEVDALVHDAIIPPPKEKMALKHSKHRDVRNAEHAFTESRDLINPTPKTKFMELVEDFQSTIYSSYWKKEIGRTKDQLPMLPKGFDIQTRTFGKKTKYSESLYDLVTPKDPVVDKSSPSKRPGFQIDRNYKRPAYNPDMSFGVKYSPDKRGRQVKCCLYDDKVKLGTSNVTTLNFLEADFKQYNYADLGISKSPNNNITCVPPGYTFGLIKPLHKLSECFTTCEPNNEKEMVLKCLGHLNTLRKGLSKRLDATFFHRFYLRLKYMDKSKTGWLPKETIYSLCASKYIRFDPFLIEPLLELWHAYDGSQIEYKKFVHIMNYREPSPTLPKIQDASAKCIDFSTTYSDMIKPRQKVDKSFRAGLPSGRYLDKNYPVTSERLCKADLINLPEESDVNVCINPSIFTNLGVSHRDMFTNRSPDLVRKVFETAGGLKFTNEQFNELWEEAIKYNSQGWVSFATFAKALNKDSKNN